MSVIRHIKIENFRTIKNLSWNPKPGLNCLIGPGDSGKSTLLDAIDLTLGARRSYSFNDADFYKLNVQSPIKITITIGNLHNDLKNIDTYGFFLRGYNTTTQQIVDEPEQGHETVLTIKLIVDSNLDPDWRLYSDRAEADGLERRLPWKHRELLSPARLGTNAHQNLAWGGRSVLNKLSEDTFDVSSVLAQLGRQTREAFAQQQIDGVASVLQQVQEISNNLGVPVGELKALLDVNGVSLSNGAISIHNSDNTPLRQLGTGSSRLLISGLQKAASRSNIIIVDEAEYGLEPYRITRLLNELGSKDAVPTQQVFITTHSPYVLRELQAQQLHVMRKPSPTQEALAPSNNIQHIIHSLNGDGFQQATLRVCAEAFFSKKVIVCEGKTEMGIVKGLDLYKQDNDYPMIIANGVHYTDGGGESMFERAKIFSSLGYPTALFKDSDKASQHITFTGYALTAGIAVFEWNHNRATEDAIFFDCPESAIPYLLKIAIERKGRDAINSHILNHSNNAANLEHCTDNFIDAHRAPLAKAANKKSWFKDIDPAEQVARYIIGPYFNGFKPELRTTIDRLFTWALNNEC